MVVIRINSEECVKTLRENGVEVPRGEEGWVILDQKVGQQNERRQGTRW